MLDFNTTCSPTSGGGEDPGTNGKDPTGGIDSGCACQAKTREVWGCWDAG